MTKAEKEAQRALSELQAAEAAESKKRAEAEAQQPDPEDAAEKFKELLEKGAAP